MCGVFVPSRRAHFTPSHGTNFTRTTAAGKLNVFLSPVVGLDRIWHKFQQDTGPVSDNVDLGRSEQRCYSRLVWEVIFRPIFWKIVRCCFVDLRTRRPLAQLKELVQCALRCKNHSLHGSNSPRTSISKVVRSYKCIRSRFLLLFSTTWSHSVHSFDFARRIEEGKSFRIWEKLPLLAFTSNLLMDSTLEYFACVLGTFRRCHKFIRRLDYCQMKKGKVFSFLIQRSVHLLW